jgi:hypothetical protein
VRNIGILRGFLYMIFDENEGMFSKKRGLFPAVLPPGGTREIR